MLRLNPRQSRGTFVRKSSSLGNLGDSSSVSHSTGAVHGAKSGMPTFYTGNDFVLIMLHWRSAQTISLSVTNEERVGRTLSQRASTQGDDDEYEFESRIRKDLPIPCRRSLGRQRTSPGRDTGVGRDCFPARERSCRWRRLVSRCGNPGVQTGARALMPAAHSMPMHRWSAVRFQQR